MAQHGGYRKPASPAPVSGPGRLSARTDGGPTNPIPPGGDYGDRQDLEAVQTAAAGAAAAPPGAGGAPRPPGGAPPAPTDVFAPTRHPDQPITAGAPVGDGEGPMPDDQLDMLHAIAQMHPHPQLTRLLEQR